jgi:hypothetical protein
MPRSFRPKPSRLFPALALVALAASSQAAARENADSRVRAGLHFRFATSAGLRLGEQIGRHALQHLLRAVERTY